MKIRSGVRALSLAFVVPKAVTMHESDEAYGLTQAAGSTQANAPPLFFDDGNEPPINPYLADSPWPMIHRNPYAQASSPWAGPTKNDKLEVDFLVTAPGSITLAYTNPDGNGDRAMWENNPFHTGKIDPTGTSLKIIDQWVEELTLQGISGAYYLLDNEGIFYASRVTTLRSFSDAVKGDPFSGIEKENEYDLPAWALGSSDDLLVGLNLLYDGYLVFCTAQGMVGVIQRDFTDLNVIQLGAGDEEISNGIAVDETGGIYIVTSKHLHRVQWNGTDLSIAWTADYELGPDQPAGGRLGAGSGSTPTLMGTGDQDKFVVITDGSPLMNIVLFWRDEIPADWTPISPGKDRRIAAEVPVTFGDPNAVVSVSEQSVLVRGYGAVVVNNDFGFDLPSEVPDVINQLLVTLTSLPEYAPYGVEKFEWNSTTRTLDHAWANPDISCPNGIPTMSTATNLMYCVGQRDSEWNIEAIDWETGESVFYKKTGYTPRYNSAYAATEIGVNREIVTGGLRGIMRARVI